MSTLFIVPLSAWKHSVLFLLSFSFYFFSFFPFSLTQFTLNQIFLLAVQLSAKENCESCQKERGEGKLSGQGAAGQRPAKGQRRLADILRVSAAAERLAAYYQQQQQQPPQQLYFLTLTLFALLLLVSPLFVVVVVVLTVIFYCRKAVCVCVLAEKGHLPLKGSFSSSSLCSVCNVCNDGGI